MKVETVIRMGMFCFIVVLISLCIFISTSYLFVDEPIAYKCTDEGDKVHFSDHEVVYVVIGIQSRPCKDMLIEIISDGDMQHNVTQGDGSCSFIQNGCSNYMITVYNKSMNVEKEFKTYPVESCYLIIV